MTNTSLRTLTILYELENSLLTEIAISKVTNLNKIISSDEEIEVFLKADGLRLVTKYLKQSDDKLTNICLKLLVNASKQHEQVRKELIKCDIFGLLALQLSEEINFSKGSLMLYAALIIMLVYENHEAQDQMRTSGCLSGITYLLNRFLEDTEEVSSKITELFVYALVTCLKEPRNVKNQTEIGWVITKIVTFLERNTIFDFYEIQLIKSLWSFLQCLLDSNEVNQQIFLECSGLILLFRSLQEIIEQEKCGEMEDVLVKMTGILVKLKYKKTFLWQACNYCPITILSKLLQTCNFMVINNVITFIEELSKEIPLSVIFLKEQKIMKAIKIARVILSKSAEAAEMCEKIWIRLNCLTSEKTNDNSNASLTSLMSIKNNFCILHDSPPNHVSASFPLEGNQTNNSIHKKTKYKTQPEENIHEIRRPSRNFNLLKNKSRKQFKRKITLEGKAISLKRGRFYNGIIKKFVLFVKNKWFNIFKK